MLLYNLAGVEYYKGTDGSWVCTNCDSTGIVDCPRCNGHGRLQRMVMDGSPLSPHGTPEGTVLCPICKGACRFHCYWGCPERERSTQKVAGAIFLNPPPRPRAEILGLRVEESGLRVVIVANEDAQRVEALSQELATPREFFTQRNPRARTDLAFEFNPDLDAGMRPHPIHVMSIKNVGFANSGPPAGVGFLGAISWSMSNLTPGPVNPNQSFAIESRIAQNPALLQTTDPTQLRAITVALLTSAATQVAPRSRDAGTWRNSPLVAHFLPPIVPIPNCARCQGPTGYHTRFGKFVCPQCLAIQ